MFKHISVLFWFGFLFFQSTVFGQHALFIQINDIPGTHVADSIFIAGNFNNWNPGKKEYVFSKKDNTYFIQLKNIPKGIYEFKFTRGRWGNVECKSTGTDIENHLLNLSSDTVVQYSVEAWKDDFTAEPKPHTASPNVQVIDTAFFMPQLQTTRRIWIYLPEGYQSGNNRYPVMYMHDGQNIFDEFTAGFGEWGVDECLDTLIRNGKLPCIVVGIDNSPRRINEYNPYAFKQFGKGLGDKYVEFLVKNLKPFVDKKYRTKPGKNNTIIAGSSMGGLISYYAMLQYPNVFGKAGIFSPAFWTAKEINRLTALRSKELDGRLFFYMGKLEGNEYVKDMNKIVEQLQKYPGINIYTIIDPNGRHNEVAWRKWFPEFYNYIIK